MRRHRAATVGARDTPGPADQQAATVDRRHVHPAAPATAEADAAQVPLGQPLGLGLVPLRRGGWWRWGPVPCGPLTGSTAPAPDGARRDAEVETSSLGAVVGGEGEDLATVWPSLPVLRAARSATISWMRTMASAASGCPRPGRGRPPWPTARPCSTRPDTTMARPGRDGLAGALRLPWSARGLASSPQPPQQGAPLVAVAQAGTTWLLPVGCRVSAIPCNVQVRRLPGCPRASLRLSPKR